MKIMFVDDDNYVLQSLDRVLHYMEKHWDMVFAGSAKEALALAGETDFDVIVADMIMPETDGATFFENIARTHPETVRIMLSGNRSRDIISRAASVTHRFLTKPCSGDQLVDTIHRTLELQQRINSPDLRKVVTELKCIPSLPESYEAVRKEMTRDNPSLLEVARIIEQDPPLSAKIMQMANSAFFARPVAVTRPAQAVSRLGLDVVRSLALSFGIYESLGTDSKTKQLIKPIWQDSLRTSGVCRYIGHLRKMSSADTNRAYTAGLLYRLGAMVVAVNAPDKWQQVCTEIEENEKNIRETEEQILGACHADISAYLLNLWGFDEDIIEAAAFYLEPSLLPGNTPSPLSALHIAHCYKSEEWAPDMAHLKSINWPISKEDWPQPAEEIPDDL